MSRPPAPVTIATRYSTSTWMRCFASLRKPPERPRGEACLERSPPRALLVPPRAESTDVERLRLERPRERGLVELVVVREDDDRGLVVGLHLRERVVRPRD